MEEIQPELKKYPNTQRILLVGLCVFAITTILVLFLPFLVTEKSWLSLNVDKPNEIGDAIGGILGPSVGLIAALLIFLAFWAQYAANVDQRKQFDKSVYDAHLSSTRAQVEARFFQLLNIHIDNRNGILQNKPTFNDLIDELHEIAFTIKSMGSELPKNITDFDVQDIAYSIFFYGPFKKTQSGNYSFQHVLKIFKNISRMETQNLHLPSLRL